MKKTLLLFTDLSENLESLIEILTVANYTLIWATNHEQAGSEIKKAIPDLILISLLKSRLYGFDFCKVLKNNPRTNDVPLILLSDSSKPENKILGYEIGADDFIEQPFLAIEVLKRIKIQIDLNNSKEEITEYSNKIITYKT